jgi:hypothetical protein
MEFGRGAVEDESGDSLLREILEWSVAALEAQGRWKGMALVSWELVGF